MPQIVLLSRAAGLKAPIDTVFPKIDSQEEFRKDAVFGRSVGFDGKMIIHPCQIEWLREVYQPCPDEVAWARRVTKAFKASQGEAVLLEGSLIDKPVADRALRILQRDGFGSGVDGPL